MTHPFTPTYIAMAKAAEEIQAMRPVGTWLDEGEYVSVHFFSDPVDPVKISLIDDGDRSGWCIHGKDKICQDWWIPRLDQLFGMLEGPCSFVHAIAHAGDGPGIYFNNEADEQRDWYELALAVVMKEKYGKIWRDGKWEKV
jgi:hypothetical protein